MKPASLNLSTPAPPALSKTKPFFFSLSERQVITTDPTNILIRSLLMKKERDARDRKAKEKAKAVAAGRAAATTTATGTAAPTEAQLSAMTKTALVDRARRAGLPVGGAKAALVQRLVEHYRTRRGG